MEKRHFFKVSVPFHFVGQCCHNHGCSLASTAVITKHFDDAVLERSVFEYDFFEVVGADYFCDDVGLELFCLVVML